MLKPCEGARDDLAHGADARGYLLVGERERDGEASLRALASCARLRQQQAREALPDLAQAKRLDQLGATPEPRGEHLERGQRDLRVLTAEASYVLSGDEEECGIPLARDEEQLVLPVAALDGAGRERAQGFRVQLLEECGAAEGGRLVYAHLM